MQLDTCQFHTHLHARIPQVDCPEHGVVQVRVPWAEARPRFTLLMERLVIDVLTKCATVSRACRLLGLSWDEPWGVMERAVARGQRRKQAKVIQRLGVDEKVFRKGHDYMTVVCDMDRRVWSMWRRIAPGKAGRLLDGADQSAIGGY